MTPSHHQRIEQVFDQALSVDVEERAAFLVEACRDAPSEVRAEVESLLAHFESGKAAGFLEEPLANILANRETEHDECACQEIYQAPPGYEILGELGRGGMGIVYKARQICLNRFVALKRVSDGTYADSKSLARFLVEAEMVARMRHPNIVQIYEVGTHNGQPFFSMEYVEGISLAEKLNRAPLPTRQAAEMARTLAHAVQAAHDAGVVHRDLKPANVLMAADGVLKVVDFGLAKPLNFAPAISRSGTIVGTPSYMAPEQAQGGQCPVSPRCDIYALGAILYELLTGQPPFRAESGLETIQLVLHQEPVPPRQLQPKVPHDLETICLKCLQKDAAKRYASAADLAEDLRRFLVGEPILARPVGKMERIGCWCRRNPWVAGLLASLALVLSGAFVSVTALWLRSEQQRALVGGVFDSVSELQSKLNQPEADLQSQEKVQRIQARTLCNLGSLQSDVDPVAASRSFEQAQQIQTDLLAKHPENSTYQRELGHTYLQLGYLYGFDIVKPEESLRWIDKAVILWETLARNEPREKQEGLQDAYLARARVLSSLARHADALIAWEQVLGVAPERSRATFQAIHAIELAYLGRHEKATATVEKLSEQEDARERTLYNAACVYAVSSAAVRQDRTCPSGERECLSERYAVRSLELLAKAKAAGRFCSRARVEKDKDLAVLHTRVDFQNFLRQLKF